MSINFYSFMQGDRESVSSDGSLMEHDKRYHPHGYHEGDKCEKRESINREDDLSLLKSLSEEEYYKPIFDSFTPTSARKWLLEQMHVECYHITDAEQTRKELGFRNLDYAEFRFMGKPISTELYNQNCILMAVICQDLKQRFPSFSLDYPLFLPYDFYTRERPWFSASSLDRREGSPGESYISLGDLDKAFQCDLRNEYPLLKSRYDIIRHEIGHNISTNAVAEAFLRQVLSQEGYFQKIRDIFGKAVERDSEEAIAEIFAHCSSPIYLAKTFPDRIEQFFKTMIDLSSQQGVAMDSAETKMDGNKSKRDRIPFWLSNAIDFISAPPEGKIAWYDGTIGKYVEFNSHDDLLQYAMRKMHVPETWTRKIIKAYPHNRWGGWEVNIIRDDYWWRKKTLEETINDLGIFVRNK